MRILFLSNVFPTPSQSTRGTFNRTLVAALSRKHAVRAIVPVPWTEEFGDLFRSGSKLGRDRTDWVDGIRVDYPRFYYPPKILRAQYGRCMWWSARKTVSRVTQEFAPNAIVAYWSHPDGEVAIRAARQAGIPAVVMVGGSDVLILARQSKSRRRAIVSVLNHADAVVCVSQDIARHVGEFGIAHDKIHVVYRGVDAQRFHVRNDGELRSEIGVDHQQRILLSVGRLVPVKGFDTLIDAYAELRQKRADFRAYIAGAGPLRSALQRQIDQLQLGDCVSLIGNTSPDELARWYQAADVCVLSSRSEGVPNVMLESIACGTPIVATEVGGIAEIADPNHDRLVPAGDHGALANAIDDQLGRLAATDDQTPPERAFEPWSWHRSADELSAILENLTRKPAETRQVSPSKQTVSSLQLH
ncbi:MAG: glycosyltransferase [Planctomycetota bacterium]|nr:glycosyltransferase [Planctomycetota bacterium]